MAHPILLNTWWVQANLTEEQLVAVWTLTIQIVYKSSDKVIKTNIYIADKYCKLLRY